MTGPAIKTKEPLRRFRRNDERSDDAAPWEGKRVATAALPNWSFWEGMVKCSGCSLISVAACVHTHQLPILLTSDTFSPWLLSSGLDDILVLML